MAETQMASTPAQSDPVRLDTDLRNSLRLVERRRRRASTSANYMLYLFLVPAFAYVIVFKYVPMYGVQIAFKDFMVTRGIWASPWAGLSHFERFFNSFEFGRLLRNTIALSAYQLVAGFPMPIILALLLNQMASKRYRKVVQTVLYAPHFISVVVVVGMMYIFLSPRVGLANQLITGLGGENIFFMGESAWFRPLYVLSNIWQHTGYGTIVYLAALSAVSPELHESAIVDGATKWQRIVHIDLPSIIPTIVILFILQTGRIMNVGFQKTYLMQTPLNLAASEVIATYVYKTGLIGAQFSFSAAVGLFEGVVNFALILIINSLARRLADSSLW